ncbi:hypothetical protein Leryth_023782 [Lithospermum erythrorhizon]|nr:hypothetical protein Leryth_023782 [Lithospermum erythrorhizon]
MANCPVEDDLDWTTDDDLEIEGMHTLPTPVQEASIGNRHLDGEPSSSNGNLVSRFTSMGFSEALVQKAIRDNEDGSEDSILEIILTYSALDSSPQQLQHANSDQNSSDYDEGFLDDFSDSDNSSGDEEYRPPEPQDDISSTLYRMGYTKEEISIAMERCGPEATVEELTDFILAAQVARADDAYWVEEVKPKLKPSDMYYANGRLKKRKLHCAELNDMKKERGLNDEPIRLPKPMIGFNIPEELKPEDAPSAILYRSLPEQAIAPPYFYYENVALAPKGVWDKIKRFLYDIEPEFVDSKYFCAAARKRAYIHNLPIENRFPLVPLPPRTINEALPMTKRWWPGWDPRKKMNCLQTAIASARLTDRIRKALEEYEDDPPETVQKYVMEQCKKWNLVWVGKNKAAPLEPDEFELLLGFPRNHTRGGGISRTDRYKSLGNSFQVDTVAYHLSVLKAIFPQGINVLSLFSGIGGAEVALHRLGIPLRNVVSVEKSEVNRNIVRSWWEQTNQKGHLIDLDDVRSMTGRKLHELMRSVGGFHLVIRVSPCNNLAGSNRVSRDGLEGKESSLFFLTIFVFWIQL